MTKQCCTDCGHPPHPGICGYALTETIRDDIGFLAPPSGEVITEIVGTCRCSPKVAGELEDHLRPANEPVNMCSPPPADACQCHEARGDNPLCPRHGISANRDRVLLAEASSAIGKCAHIIGADTTNSIIARLSLSSDQ